jgi:hypothetical protein
VPRPAWDDEEDWVGEPPEGRHSADRARPEFWRGRRAPEVIAGVLLLAVIVVVVVLLVH